MRALCSLALLVSSTAYADVPGTFDDPVVAHGVLPHITDAPLAQDLVFRGDRVAVMFDSFELPTVFHHRLRSMVTNDSTLTLDSSPDYGRATRFLMITPPDKMPRSASITAIDIGVSTLRVAPVATDHTPQYFDALFVLGPLKAIATEKFARAVYTAHNRFGAWTQMSALSPLIDESGVRLDSRTYIEYRGPAAGLRRLLWRTGGEISNIQALQVRTAGGWTRASALLSPNLLTHVGVRVDNNGIQPRGGIESRLPYDVVAVVQAGAYRHDSGMRVTEVAAALARRGTVSAQLTAYYQDRLMPPAFGSAAGLELMSSIDTRPWLAFVSASISKSIQHEGYRMVAHPTTYDQPLRINVVGKYRARQWSLGARFQLSSGLPYLPVVESVYDSDTDSYRPLFALRHQRLPFHHELSVRFDYRFNKHVRAFVDVRNAYAADTTLGYAYSYDFKTRVAVTLPILPFAGVRGEL